MVLLTTLGMLYITSPGFIFLIVRKLVRFDLLPQFCSGNHQSVLCIYEFSGFGKEGIVSF